jgi:uncharacterized integral membrane protein (TIGR00697 family)
MRVYKYFPFVTAIFVTSLVVSNIIAVKLASFGALNLGAGRTLFLYLPAAVIVFPVAYIFGDVLTEVYGYVRARQVIWIGFACNLLAVAAIGLAGLLPPAPFWNLGVYSSAEAAQLAYLAILGFAPRLLLASFVAYLFGEFLNSFILAKLKVATQGRHLWVRTIGSTLVGELADSAIFITIAFLGILPAASLVPVIITQWLFKSAYEALATPLTYVVVNFLKKAENEDYFDRDTNFNPLRLREDAPVVRTS